MKTVNIIGAGRVGRSFLRLLGPRVRDIASASRTSAEAAVLETGHGHAADPADMSPADIWLLAVPDTRIADAAKALAETEAPPAIAIHFSGFHTADIMDPLRARGWHIASAHPNFSFADPESAAAGFPGTPCGLEGDDPAIAAIEALLIELGAHPFRIASGKKALYHAAAVFSNNFATVLQAIAREAWQDAGVPDAIAADINAALLRATVENVVRLGPVDALTGPAARKDRDVVQAQRGRVADWHPAAGEVYALLSAMAEALKSTGKTR